MVHAQKTDFVFRRNGRVHLNRRGRQFGRLLAAEVCASAVVMLDTPCSVVVWRVLATHSIRQFPLHFPSRASPCAITFQLDSRTVQGTQPATDVGSLTEMLRELTRLGSGQRERIPPTEKNNSEGNVETCEYSVIISSRFNDTFYFLYYFFPQYPQVLMTLCIFSIIFFLSILI
jgi:hypothetical protein